MLQIGFVQKLSFFVCRLFKSDDDYPSFDDDDLLPAFSAPVSRKVHELDICCIANNEWKFVQFSHVMLIL